MLAIFSSFKFIEYTVWKWPETLGATGNMQIQRYYQLICLNTVGKFKPNNNYLIQQKWISLGQDYNTHTKHFGWNNSPLELTIFAFGSNPSSQRAHAILSMFMILQKIQYQITHRHNLDSDNLFIHLHFKPPKYFRQLNKFVVVHFFRQDDTLSAQMKGTIEIELKGCSHPAIFFGAKLELPGFEP